MHLTYISEMNLLFLSASFLTAIACKRTPQNQPPSYRKPGIKADRGRFEQHDLAQVGVNAQIPSIEKDSVRIATYNVHFHRNLYDKADNTEQVAADLKAFNPTVVVFEEVVNDQDPRRAPFESMLTSLGYIHREMAINRGLFLGNMIASKIPITLIEKVYLDGARNALAVSVKLSEGREVAIIGTHLDNLLPETRVAEAKKIMDFVNEKIKPKYTNYLLTGDFNDHWGTDPLKTFVGNGTLKEAFTSIGAPYPKYTCWAGTTIDFILRSDEMAKATLGAYVYHTVSSDHLPVMIDVKADHEIIGSSTSSPEKETSTFQFNWTIVAVVVVVIAVVIAAVGFWYWKH